MTSNTVIVEKKEICKFRIAENMGGHDGCATGGHYGSWTNIFGIFPEKAVVVGDEKPGAVHSYKPGRLAQHKDIFEKEYSINESLLEPNDWVATENGYDGQVHNNRRGDVTVIAHRLPLVEAPKAWIIVGGSESSHANGYGESKQWTPISTSTGEKVCFDSLAVELNLKVIPHPYGQLWLDGDTPVAVNAKLSYSWGKDGGYEEKHIMGDLSFFRSKGYAVHCYHDKNTYYGAGDFFSCSQDIVLKNQTTENLRSDGWYPVEVKEHYVIWATGLHLYPKHLEWNKGMHPASGLSDKHIEQKGKDEADLRGTRLFDSSEDRLEKVTAFFKEKICFESNDPWHVYEMMANASDPRNGKWKHGYHYPPSWTPEFDGWDLSHFSKLECRWKQPQNGNARFYGICR